ncbi:MAG: hypothetical protein M1834_000284 [Cirrosporium novae-zelandiae]|nr:MAG: hypothetical protein M1834_000284 [Cirrosporium novae-zelandiae]
MATTELAIPSLKRDAESIAQIEQTLVPNVAKTFKEPIPNLLAAFLGRIIFEDEKDVRGDSRFSMVLKAFKSFLDTSAFMEFKSAIMPLVNEVKLPQIYTTDVGPIAVAEAVLTEFVRVEVGEDGENKKIAEEKWSVFCDAVKAVTGKVLSGMSVNVEIKTWMGVVGWDSEESRQHTFSDSKVQHGLKELLEVGNSSDLVIDFQRLQ